MAGWGDLFGKFAQMFPGRVESIKNEIDRLEREEDAITKRPSTDASIKRLGVIAERLRVIREQVKNAASA